MKNFYILFLAIPLLVFDVSAQKAPIRFGDVSMEDLEMKSYPADTSAPAVVLCDYGYFDAQNVQFIRTIRIKILKKEGYNWANYVFPASYKSQVRGITFNLENGKIVQEKLKNESIFSERITNDRYRIRVAMPAIRVGCVFDIQLVMKGIPNVWKFQDIIPVKYSELLMEWTQYVDFTKNFYGFERLSYTSPTRWVANNMPAFKVEPYINSEENYITKLEFGIQKFMGYDYASTWEAVSKTLIEGSDFQMAQMGSAFLNTLSRNISESGKSKEEMARMACDSLKKSMKWNKEASLFPSSLNLPARYKMKDGNSSEINLMLIMLLKKLDIETTPVVLSTRENGVLSPIFASIDKLNYVIALANVGDKSILLDATDPYLPSTILPFRCLNYEGRTVNKEKSEQVDLTPVAKDKKVVMYDLKVNDDKSFTGKILIQHSDYSAGDFRESYSKYNSQDEFLDDFKKNKPGLIVTKMDLDNIDNKYLPVTESYEVTINNLNDNNENDLIFLPLFYEQMKENPFKMEERKCPVDFGFKTDKTVIVTINLPDGYKISALPASVNLRLEGGAASYLFQAVQTDALIKLTSKLSIGKSLFLPDEYTKLKEFFNQVIIKQSEPIILKKS
jgi:hypothetical protein